MLRREFLALLGGGVSAWPIAGHAQQPAGRVAKVAILSPFLKSAAPAPAFDAFSGALRGLGWVEGRNVLFERRWAEGHADRLPALANELVQLKPDLIFSAWGTPTAVALKKATTDIPIVFAGVGDAIGVGLVEGLVRPGGNLTGSTFISELTIAKQLELLRETAPTLSRVGVLINPSNPVYGPVLKASEAPAQAMKLQLQVLGPKDAADFQGVFETASRDRVDGLISLRDPLLVINASRIVELAEKYKLPAVHGLREFVDAGGLMSYGPDTRDMYRRAAYLVDKLLGGAKPNDVPVEQSTRFELVVNLRAAKAAGISIPTSILLRADEVIE